LTARCPDEPIKPKKPLVLAMGLGVGLLLGMVTAVVRKSLIGGVEDVEVIERQLNVPVYAVIPHSVDQAKLIEARAAMKDARFPMLAKSHPNDAAIEGLRSLRTSLQFATADAKNNIIAIGGQRPAIGKSFVSELCRASRRPARPCSSLMATCARDTLHDYFGGVCSPGLSGIAERHRNLTAAGAAPSSRICISCRPACCRQSSELLMSDASGNCLTGEQAVRHRADRHAADHVGHRRRHHRQPGGGELHDPAFRPASDQGDRALDQAFRAERRAPAGRDF
jgi:tyrosine-protein kinase Etk/Wzc